MIEAKVPVRYFLTTDWCNEGKRGVFCNMNGAGFSKDTPHTEEEMHKILGDFWMILYPESTPLTQEELKEYNKYRPLAEYSMGYGIARKEEENERKP